MSATNLGDQYITFDYKHPAKGSDFNTLLREAITPGVYKGGLITYSGTGITIAPFVIYINTSTDKLVRIETRANVNITVTESTPVIALTYTWQDVSEDWLDFNQRASGSGALTNEVCLGECIFGGGVITSITYASKTWGKKFTNDVPIGTSPFIITSTTKVSNLNVDQVDGADLSTDVTFAGNSDVLIPSQKAVKTLTSHPITAYKQATYPITDTDGLQVIEVDTTAGAVTITLPLMANNLGRQIRIQFVKNDASLDVVTISPHTTDAGKLSNDLLASIILPKVGDFIVVQQSVNSDCWEIVNERITSQLRLDTYAGYGSTDTKIMRFTTVTENFGNMFSENHVSGYSGNAKGLEITINRSGRYAFIHSGVESGTAAFYGLSLNSAQRTTDVTSITANTICSISFGSATAGIVMAYTAYLKKGDIMRPHSTAIAPGNIFFSCTYLGN